MEEATGERCGGHRPELPIPKKNVNVTFRLKLLYYIHRLRNKFFTYRWTDRLMKRRLARIVDINLKWNVERPRAPRMTYQPHNVQIPC